MCDRVVSEDPVLLVYCPDKYKTLGMYDESVDHSLLVTATGFEPTTT